MKAITPQELKGFECKPGSHGEIRYHCLFCPDTKYHMYVNTTKGLYICFKCGAKGLYLTMNQERELESFEDRINNYTTDSEYSTEKEIQKKSIKTLPRNTFIEHNKKAWDYLRERDISTQEIEQLRESLDSTGTYSKTIIFPVWHDCDDLGYFVARKYNLEYGDSGPKYVNAPWPKEGVLYSPNCAMRSNTVVVCEGPFDALRIARVNPVRALLGKTATKEQLKNLIHLGYRKIIVMLDPDAELNALRLRCDLVTMAVNQEIKVSIYQAPSMASDPGDSTEAEIQEAIDHVHFFRQGR